MTCEVIGSRVEIFNINTRACVSVPGMWYSFGGSLSIHRPSIVGFHVAIMTSVHKIETNEWQTGCAYYLASSRPRRVNF